VLRRGPASSPPRHVTKPHVLARHLLALVLPVTVTIVVPWLVLAGSGGTLGWDLRFRLNVLVVALGCASIAVGLAFVVWTVSLFVRVGRGTLAPWDPTQRLVARGPYRRVRNPMISGVGGILLGEVLIAGSLWLALWFAIFAALNAVYIPLVEEPGLRRRFGDDYRAYAEEVPRWVPRLRA
jgi:protein-S-isoprenylcysteine O-methyltransferase Ste14